MSKQESRVSRTERQKVALGVVLASGLSVMSVGIVGQVEANSLPENSGHIITNTKNHLLSMMYHLQPKVEVEIPDDLYFTDVEAGIWYDIASKYVVSQQIMAGTSNLTFSPHLTVTRGLMAVVIANTNQAEVGVYPNVFTDAESQWYRDSANWCARNGIIYGYTSDVFGGEDPITREQMAVILYKYAKFISMNTGNMTEIGRAHV